MKVHIELDKNIFEPEIKIYCSHIDNKITDIQNIILDMYHDVPLVSFYKDDKEFYFSLDEVLFFETEDNTVFAHLKDDVYKVKFKLYELENILPKDFIRISKSAILNIKLVFSIDRSLASYSLIQFYNSHKKVYVSRFYYKNLKHKLDERRKL